MFTIEYSQPSEYRFSLDSIETPVFISEWILNSGARPRRVLDLCAGCGVMGFELAFHLKIPLQIDFLEIQDVYKKHFEQNLQTLKKIKSARGEEFKTTWIQQNYSILKSEEFKDRYDLIIANPPYFKKEDGALSPSSFKNRCRFFLDETPETLWDGVGNALAEGGSAFLLSRPGSLGEIRQRLKYSGDVQKAADIRGTELLRISKNVTTQS